MNTPTPSLATIICTRDRPDDLEACLQLLTDQSPVPDEVILVLGSKDSCPPAIQSSFPKLSICVIECFEHNISKSRNAGLSKTQSSIVLFLDDDACVRPGWVGAYIKAFDQHPQSWAIGGDVYDARCESPTLEFSRGILAPTGIQRPVVREHDACSPLGFVANVKGCNFGIRREPVLGIGGFDPFFAFAFDEADLMVRIHRAGGEVVHEPAAMVDHAHTPGHYRASSPMDHDWRVQYASHTMFVLKHTTGKARIRGRFIIRRRQCKLMIGALGQLLSRGLGLRRVVQIFTESSRGIRDAHRAFCVDQQGGQSEG